MVLVMAGVNGSFACPTATCFDLAQVLTLHLEIYFLFSFVN